MNRQVVRTSSGNPRLSISKVSGSLHIFGWENPEINIEGGLIEELRMGEEGELLKIHSGNDCRILVPMGASAQIERCGSDATIEQIEGPIMIGRVSGNLTLRAVGGVSVDHVGSDFSADNVKGDLVSKRVSGTFRGRNIQGAVQVESAGSDFYLENAFGPLIVSASGNVRATLSKMNPGVYSIRSGSDLALRVPAGVNVKVSMECGSNHITIRTPEVTDVLHNRWYTLTLGTGEIEILLKSSGNMLFSSHPADQVPTSGPSVRLEEELSNLGTRIAQQVSDQLRAANLSARVGAEMSERMSQVTQEAMQKAEDRILEAMRRMERNMASKSSRMNAAAEAARASAEAARAANKDRVIIPPVPPASPQQTIPPVPAAQTEPVQESTPAQPVQETSSGQTEESAPPVSKVTDDERLLILQMVENKKISVEEAEQLLEAIEEIAGEEQG